MPAYPLSAVIVGSVFSSVSLIATVKQTFNHGFPFVFTLSTMHFCVTFLLLNVMSKGLGLFKVKYLPPMTNFKVGAFGVGSICMMNFSLQYNSVGIYQLAKLCVIPCVMVMNIVMYGEEPASRKIRAALVLVILGVGMATVTDIHVNALGSFFAVLAIGSTSQFQIWQGRKQKEFGMSGLQCALSAAWVQMLVAGVLAILLEVKQVHLALSEGKVIVGQGDKAHEVDSGSQYMYGLVALSCLLAVSVNVHGFLLIGKTSVVTYQVIGHAKTCLILAFGYWTLFVQGANISDILPNVMSVGVALLGVFVYSNIKVVETEKKGGEDWCDRFAPRPLRALLNAQDLKYSPLEGREDDAELGELRGER